MALENGVTELETITVKAPKIAENSSNATEVRGDAKWKTCWRHACYLAKYIYKDPAPAGGFHTQFPEKIAEVERYWEKWDELVQQGASGLVARLFKVKGYDPNSKTDVCPPCLVFRGTDFDDMRNLAVVPTVKVLGHTFYNKPTILDKTIDSNTTKEQLVALGWKSTLIYTEDGWPVIEGATSGSYLSLPCSVSLEIFSKENGDWSNNIQQGLGKGSAQYRNAATYGTRQIIEKIRPSNDKRLEITGHSLGGGLASAVCCVLSRLFPSIYIHAIVFNPSGVHPNTIRPATAADGKINVFSVKDEFLTTVQSHRNLLPVIGSVFRLAKRTIKQDGMPDHLGIMMQMPGTSPGQYDETWSVPPKGSHLPVLFPINQQTLVPFPKKGGFPAINKLDTMLNASPSVSLFATEAAKYLNETYRSGADKTLTENSWMGLGVYRIDSLYVEMGKRYVADLQPEIDALMKIFEASASYHGMDYVIATYDKTFGKP
ncbi:hypothetical protein FS827_10430 [Agrobacterium vitis]|uniref:hypothetical protein n=1 Tax=Allorhizobium ampelinum TaxID=3025782 RepID=UPI001F1E0861|nr:hypothetical protein [Allorhizobium ampelinum]MCF1461742.1 hypothetical protein [Allorhizobium ampelinum]